MVKYVDHYETYGLICRYHIYLFELYLNCGYNRVTRLV